MLLRCFIPWGGYVTARSWRRLYTSGCTSSEPFGHLTRTSHQPSTAVADTGMSTVLRSVGLLDVVSTTPPGPSVARLVSTPVYAASQRTLVRNAG